MDSKKCIIPIYIFILLLISGYSFAQTSPMQKTPQTLAQEMAENIAQQISLSQEQKEQITNLATSYYINLRNASKEEASVRTNLSIAFQQDLKDILTEDVYNQWQEYLKQRQTLITSSDNK